MKQIILILLSQFAMFEMDAQNYKISSTPILSYLYNYKGNISSISNTKSLNILPEFIMQTKASQKLIKTKNGLYILIDGTGKVFKAVNLTKNVLQFDRIDSTYYFGNSFYSIDFALNDTIYSFGGYGFWHNNGQLRHFNTSKEWSISKVKNIRNTINYIQNFQLENNVLYYIEPPNINEESDLNSPNFNIVKFDIIKKINIILGRLNNKIKISGDFMVNLPSLNGTIINSERNILLLNFNDNKVYKLKNEHILEVLLDKSGTTLQITFEKDGKIFYTNYPDTSLKTIPISINDFKLESYSLYEPIYNNTKWGILGLSVLILFLISASKIIVSKKNSKKDTEILICNPIIKQEINNNSFNNIEKALIEQLIEKNKHGKFLTVDDINSYLGTKKKSIEIQKSIRTDAINRINHKFNNICNVDSILIQRIRSLEDARYMNYIINEENSKIIEKMFRK